MVYGSTYIRRNLVLFGFDGVGRPLWNAGQRRIGMDRDGEVNFPTDIWRVDGDSLHFIYGKDSIEHNFVGIGTQEYVTRSISTRTGSMTPPRLLLKTGMILDPRYSIWNERHGVVLVLNTPEYMRLVGMRF